jgi:hypothetical protein
MKTAIVTHSSYLVITNCTGRKRKATPPLQISELKVDGSIAAVAAGWVSALRLSDRCHRVEDYYAGRAFSEALETARYLGASTFVVSAGLGLIAGDENIPSYDLTISDGKNCVLNQLDSISVTSTGWWKALNKEIGVAKPFENILKTHPQQIVLIALPSTYLAMIADELLSLSTPLVARLRIFTSGLGRRLMPSRIQKQVMPYDERLETTDYGGTRSDFPQRALRHFVMQLQAESLSTFEASERVIESLENQNWRLVPVRVKKTDEEIIDCLCTNWDAYGGTSGRLLRCLRDDLGIACEQSRFRMLWKQAQEIKGRRGN